jgi:two-component system, NarL family, invasion response regulator UvrY
MINIALADDHMILRKGVKDIISSFGGFEVIMEASNGKELITTLYTAKLLPDICMLDINMPDMNGYDTIVALKKNWPTMKVLVLTMFNNEYSILKMLKNGANGYLLKKNCHPNDLKLALTTIYNKGYYHSDFITSRLIKEIENEEKQPPKITEKEMQFLAYCCTDYSYKEIAGFMNLSQRTVEGYRDALFEKLNLNSRTALAVYAISSGIVPIEQ